MRRDRSSATRFACLSRLARLLGSFRTTRLARLAPPLAPAPAPRAPLASPLAGLPAVGGVDATDDCLARTMAHYVGLSTIFVGAIELIPLAAIPIGRWERTFAPCFIFPGLCAMAAGYLLYFLWGRGLATRQLGRREASACALVVWLVAIAVYAVPFVAAGLLDPFQAIFESTSGLTTTGLSVMDVDACPRVFLLHRSLMHYFGGVGLVLVLTSLLRPGGGLRVFDVEGHADRLLPGTTATARVILILYTSLIAVGALAYRACGMPAFDAVNMAISAVSTGGFAVHASSIASYGSLPVEIVSIVLMLAGATSFALNFALVRGDFRAFFRHVETGCLYGIILAATVAMTACLLASGQVSGVADAARIALFQTVAIITTTGFQTIPSLAVLPASALFVAILLMFVGAEAGSTSGGIKVYRAVLATLGVVSTLRERYGRVRAVRSVKVSRYGRRVACTREEMDDAMAFVLVYVLVFAAGCFVFALCGADVRDAVFDFASCLGNVGVSVGFITASSGPVVLLVGSVAMLLGRLEIIPACMGALWLITAPRERRRAFHA